MKKRNLLLQQMGITQWQLHRPESLKGVVQIFLQDQTELVIISEQIPDKSAVLFQDILIAINLTQANCLCLNLEQALHLNLTKPVIFWLLGENNEKIDRTLAQFKQPITIWKSPNFADFHTNIQAKRQLWQQMQCYLSQHSD